VHTRTIDAHRFGPATTAASAAARNANFCHFVLLVAFSITFTCARNCHAPHGMMLAETPSMWQGAMHSVPLLVFAASNWRTSNFTAFFFLRRRHAQQQQQIA